MWIKSDCKMVLTIINEMQCISVAVALRGSIMG